MQDLQRISKLEGLIPLVTNTVKSAVTKRVYSRELRAFFEWYEQRVRVEGFSRATVMDYRDEMISTGRGPVSINSALSAIRRLATEAADTGLLDSTAAARIERVKGVANTKTRLGRWLTAEELKALLAGKAPTTPNRGMRDRCAIWIMGVCGLRREEAASLTFNQLQHRDGRPAFIDVCRKGGKLHSIPIHPLAYAAITEWCDHAGIFDKDAFLLPTISNPDRITQRRAAGARLYAACERYSRAFGLEFRPHDLRRTFAVLARKGGADFDAIREALGHSSIRTTEIYLRGPLSMQNAATDKIAL